MSVWRFSQLFANVPGDRRITLGEGNTPLLRSRSIGPKAGLANLFFKVESSNPSGSYKDRFAAVAVSHMWAQGQRVCLATSSGNTGSALAAYCAAANIVCRIVIVETTPDGKLKQMLAYGAELVRVKGFGLDSSITANTMECLKRQAESTGGALQISAFRFSPEGMSGVQSIAYELAEQFPKGIDHIFCPAGGGGLLLAVARGFASIVDKGQFASSPAIHCVQPAGNNTIAGPLRGARGRAQAVLCTSNISGLQVPNVIDGDEAIVVCRRTGGTGHLIDDDEAWTAQYRLSHEEGIFCEPAAAVSVAGLLRAATAGEIKTDATFVCLITGSAFKDPASLVRLAGGNGCELIDLPNLPTWLSR